MPFKIKNWKLAILAIVFIGVFTSLGCWQLSRANQKKLLLKSFTDRTAHAPLTADNMKQTSDLRFYRAELEGSFDNAHTVLLDNKTFEGKIGYEVYTPFKANDLATPILVDRGFIPIGQSRKELPPVNAIIGTTTIVGLLNLPPTYVAMGQIVETSTLTWPLRVEYINITEVSKLLGYTINPYILSITPNDPAAYDVKWQVVTMSPEKHQGYAVQWFALAITLLILFVALNRTTPQQ